MDLVRCDGAVLYYGKKCWLLGVTPTESEIVNITEWLLESHHEMTGLSTDSLLEAGYPGAVRLGGEVCGMAAARITAGDFLLWFRSHTEKEIKWAGAKHALGEKDDGKRMNPRASFNAFLESVKHRSLPWEDVEMDAIHSLQLLLRSSFQDIDTGDIKMMIHARMNELRIEGLNELSTVASGMVRLIETATAPIFSVDARGLINGWNGKIADLTGLPLENAMGKLFAKEIVHEKSFETADRVFKLGLEGW
jgi:phytochrome B